MFSKDFTIQERDLSLRLCNGVLSFISLSLTLAVKKTIYTCEPILGVNVKLKTKMAVEGFCRAQTKWVCCFSLPPGLKNSDAKSIPAQYKAML